MSDIALRLEGVRRTFVQGERSLEVLRDIDLAANKGEIVALVGPSGSGKSTLLHTAGLLEAADAGEVFIDDRACARLGDGERTAIRRAQIGFVYQFHHLMPEFSALENVMIPQRIAGTSAAEARALATDLLNRFGLGARTEHPPGRLSGGEQQRVAIARAVANNPLLLLADEPTGNLDQATADVVFAELLDLARERGVAALIATHNDELARRMDRIVRLDNGLLREG